MIANQVRRKDESVVVHPKSLQVHQTIIFIVRRATGIRDAASRISTLGRRRNRAAFKRPSRWDSECKISSQALIVSLGVLAETKLVVTTMECCNSDLHSDLLPLDPSRSDGAYFTHLDTPRTWSRRIEGLVHTRGKICVKKNEMPHKT
jgi:hypothetical protein